MDVRLSKGHIGFLGDFEFYEIGGEVYRAPIANEFDVRIDCRIGRWECSRMLFDRFRDTVFKDLKPGIRKYTTI